MNSSFTFPVNSILLVGPTGVGKSPLGNALASKGFLGRHCHHLDFGSLLRRLTNGEISSPQFSSNDLEFISGVLHRGFLLENEHFPLARKIVFYFLECSGFLEQDILLLNGLPRHLGQAQDVSTLARIHALIVLECSSDSVYARIQTNIGGDRSDRIDDEKELVAKKLDVFQKRTYPLIDYYERSGSIIYRMPVSSFTSTADVLSQLSLLSSSNPPIALVSEPPER